MRRLDSELWYQAMVCEMEAHLENGTWELVKLPPGRKAIGSKWVFKVKRNPNGTVERYEAHLVAKGFGQHPGVDFDETFAPTTKWAALRAILALAALKNLELESINISNAYLNSELHDVNMYMQQPDGFAERDAPACSRVSTASSRAAVSGLAASRRCSLSWALPTFDLTHRCSSGRRTA
jgi:hypothetical protein